MADAASKGPATESPTPEPPSAARESAASVFVEGFKSRLDAMRPERVAAFRELGSRTPADFLERMLGIFPIELRERVAAQRAALYGGDVERELAAIEAGQHPLQQSAA